MAEELRSGLGRFLLHSVLNLCGLIGLCLAFEALAPQAGTRNPTGSGILTVLGGAVNFVAEIAAQAGWVILPVAAVWLLIRRLHALAAYVGTLASGMMLLVGVGQLFLGFGRAVAGGDPAAATVFSSGSIQLVVTCGALLLVFLPTIPVKAVPWAIGGATLAVATFEVIRVLTGAVPLWPVAGGWLTAVGWLAATVWAFRRWQRSRKIPSDARWDLPVDDKAALMPAPEGDPLLPGGRRSALKLGGAWLLLASAVTGLGLLITEAIPSVQSFDQAVVEWFAANRTETLSALATMAGSFGTTGGIIGVLIVVGALVIAITRRRAPTMFLVTAVVGETALYLLSGVIVGRPRPDVDHLSEGVPPTSSFPSGHVAAAVVMYAGLALLLRAWVQSRLRKLGFILAPLIVLGVLLSRLYWGVHYPTDTIASLLFATVWLGVCWRYFLPARGSPAIAPQPALHETADEARTAAQSRTNDER